MDAGLKPEHSVGRKVDILARAIQFLGHREHQILYIGLPNLGEFLVKVRQADVENLVLAVSEELDCTSEDIDLAADRVLWFKTGIHVYNVVDLAEECAVQAGPAGP